MDPAFDKKPQKDYKCKICKKTGDHLFTLCPKNRDPKSLTQRRRRNAERSAKNGANHRQDYGSDFDNSHQPRFRNDRTYRLGESPRGRHRSCSPLGRPNGNRRRDMSPPGYGQAIHRPVSPVQRHNDRKRRREEPCVEDKRAKKKARKVTFCDDLVIEIKDIGEGRLSYSDVPATSRSALTPRSPDGKKMELDVSNLSVQEKSSEPASKVDGFLGALDEMIKEESTATELLLVLNGIELRCSSPIFKLFKGAEEKIWVRRDKARRARPSDYFDLLAEGGHHAGGEAECQILAQETVTKGHEQPWTRVINQENDAISIDMALTDRTRPLKDMGAAPIPVVIKTGTLFKSVAQESFSPEVETDGILVGRLSKGKHSAFEGGKSETRGTQSPRLIECAAMRVAPLLTVAEEPASCQNSNQPALSVGHGEVINESACPSQELSEVILDNESRKIVDGPSSFLQRASQETPA